MADDKNSIDIDENNDDLKFLLDSSYPLLQEFRNTCAGTYKHSQALSSMVEAVAISLELDVTKLKVAAQYHDIGKMFCPKFFTENQSEDENPHDDLDPSISYYIITRHVSDSTVILLNDGNFPREIIELVSQHHGNSILSYFFNKSGSDDENDFRYKTTKPTCIESAVLMVCDRIEATSRSLIQSGKFNISVIDITINDLIDDGQLDEVVMRLGDLKKMKEELVKELEGTYQKRIDYDEVNEEEKEKKGK